MEQMELLKARCKALKADIALMEKEGNWGAVSALSDELSDTEAALCSEQAAERPA